jgi:hypothetical protein
MNHNFFRYLAKQGLVCADGGWIASREDVELNSLRGQIPRQARCTQNSYASGRREGINNEKNLQRAYRHDSLKCMGHEV